MTDLSCHVRQQGPNQVEVVLDYHLDDRDQHRLVTDLFIFSPQDLRPMDYRQEPEWFFRDFAFSSRFLSPALTLDQVLDPDCDTSPLHRLAILSATVPGRWKKSQRDAALYELMTLLNILRNRLDEGLAYHRGPMASGTAQWFRRLGELKTRWADLQEALDRDGVPRKVRQGTRWCGEGQDLILRNAVLSVLEYRSEETELIDTASPWLDGLDSSDSQTNAEERLFRESRLRLWSERALYVQVRRSKIVERVAEVMLALAAAMAMAAALFATILSTRHLESNTIAWAMAVVAIYILKDRLKDTGKRVLLQVLPSLVDHRGHYIHDPLSLRRCGRVRERVRFPKANDLPKEIRKLRQAGKDSLARSILSEDVVHYRKETTIDARRLSQGHTRFVGLEELLRLDFRHWRYRLEQGQVDTLEWRDNRVERIRTHRVRHYDMILRVREDLAEGDLTMTLRYRLVMSLDGILRLEHVSGPTESPRR